MTAPRVPVYQLNDGLTMPQIGFGTYQLRGPAGVDAITHALQVGYRLLDTAVNYDNEAEVGQGVRRSGVPRETVRIQTKIPGRAHVYELAFVSVENSLRTSGLDYLDSVLIHWPNPSVGLYREAWQALVDCRERGLVQTVGVSNFTPAHLADIIAATGVVPAVNQIELHPHFPQSKLRRVCTERGIAVESWSPLGGSGAGWGPLTRPNSLLTNPVIAGIGEQYGKSAAQVLIRWQLQQGLIVIPKSVHRKRVAANADVWDFDLSERDMKRISRLETGLRVGADPDDLDLGSPKD